MGIKRKITASNCAEVTTLEAAFNEYLMEKEARNLSPKTLTNYQDTFNVFMNFNSFDSNTEAKEVTSKHIYKWISVMKQNAIKPSSINHYLRDMRAFLYWCMDADRAYIEKPFKIQLIEGQEEQLKLFTDDEVAALLEKPRRNDSFAEWRSWAIVNWVLATGNRAATICDVRISDINYGKKEITLHHTKNKKAQILPLSSSLEVVLKEYIRMWRWDSVDGWLFPNVGEEQLTTHALRLAFGRYCKNRGVTHANIHGLRHNFAKGWVQNNGNMFALQKILGHSSLDMTKKYVRLFAEDIKEDYDKFNPLDTIKRTQRRTQTIKKG